MFLTILINFLLAINIVVCALIILVVLMQRPKSEGLGAAFGGGMTENLFGAQTTTVLTNITRWLGGIFFALTLILSILYSQQAKRSVSKSDNLLKLMETATPASQPAVPAQAKPVVTVAPTSVPSVAPTVIPTVAPTAAPTAVPTVPPTAAPDAAVPATAPAAENGAPKQ